MSSNKKSSLVRRIAAQSVAEMMESRRMFAVVNGTSGNDTLVIEDNVYTLNGTAVFASNSGLSFNLLGGNDTVTVLTTFVGATVRGGEGNDTIIGGSKNDVLDGGDGNDSLRGNLGNDSYYFFNKLNATPETDTIDEPSSGSPNDSIDFYDASVPVKINLGSSTVATMTGRTVVLANGDPNIENASGGSGADSIKGSAGPNVVFAGAGNDTVDGQGGADNISGGDNNDLLFGGTEDDSLFGEDGDDTVVGDAGNDLVDGGAGTNQLFQDSLPQPEIFLESDGGGIPDGDTTPNVDNFTDFGTLAPGASKSFTYFVFNDGDGPLNTLGLKIVDSASATSTKFTITEPLNATIAAGEFDTFTVKFTSLTAGIFTHTLTFNNNDADENPYNFAIRGTVQGTTTTAPEVGVLGNGVSITDGDTTPSTTDATDFGTTTSGVAISKTFTVKNTGTAALTTSNLKVTTTSGAAITSFTITEGLSASIPAGGSDTFTVKFLSTVAGTQTAMVSFNNNDSNENPYNYYIKATVGTAATAPEVEVRGNNVVIADGDTTPSTSDSTDFGTVKPNVSVSKTFTVKNTGTKTLTTSGLKCVTTAGAASSTFTITEGLSASIAPGASDTFTVKFISGTLGSVTRMLTFSNNDSNENPYNFYVKANVSNTTLAPEAEVRGNNVVIADGDTSPTSGDFTNFGSKSTTGTITKTFTLKNTGMAALLTSGLKIVTTAGVASSTFTIVEGLSSSIAAGGSDTFTIKFVTTAKGSYTRMISFVTNDSNENPYNFYISGTVV